MHVVDGEIKYVETDNTGDDNYDGLHQVRACLRGRSMRRRVYNPDRLKYPMKRVGKRGKENLSASAGKKHSILSPAICSA
jgi:anaerobic dimethyl sulfoxide reductase subunit A